jgi:Ca2+-binding RTX toxin-like protein
MRRLFSVASLVTAVALAGSLLVPSAASAQETLGASCEPPREDTSGGWDYVAQVFTPQFSGPPAPLTRAEILVTHSGTADYVIEIRVLDLSGKPTSAVVATTAVSGLSVPSGDTFISASFPNPVDVGAGTSYALVVHRTVPDSLSVGYRIGDDCPGGSAWFGDDASGAAWFSGAFDMVFRVFVTLPQAATPPPPPPPPPTVPAAPSTCKGKAATIVGTNGANQLTGTPAADVIAALGGNDQVSGLAGNDTICGGAGKDTLTGGKGKDTLLGQAGKDKLKGGGGKDFCMGGKGNDTASACEVEKSI